MKSIIPGLLGAAERALLDSTVPASLLASNSESPIEPVVAPERGLGALIGATASQALAADGAVSGSAPVLQALVQGMGASAARGLAAERLGGQQAGLADHAADAHAGEHDHHHEDGICEGLLSESDWLATQGSTDLGLSTDSAALLSAPLMALDQTFRLHSNPGASRTIYLDFNGHTTSGTAWNTWNNGAMGSSFVSPAFDIDANPGAFSDSELILIQRAWQRVAADFAAFDVNVTTQEPLQDWLIKSSSTDVNYGIRTVITSYGPSSGNAGGIAYIDSFNWNSDTPAFVYNTSLLGVAEAISHEVGHSLGLSHDGTFDAATNTNVAYYSGHGSGDVGWAPIMGAGYYQNVTTWDNGTYYNSNNTGAAANYSKGADDLAVITTNNGFSYRSDLEGDGMADATTLAIGGGAVSQFGTIETAFDVDVFRFDLVDVGSIDLSFDPYVYRAFVDSDGLWGGATSAYYASVSDADSRTVNADHGTNLDLSVSLLNSAGWVVASSNPYQLGARLLVSGLAAGAYYLRLDGVGVGDPTSSTPSGYSDYASIGNYLISGSVTGAATSAPTPVITLAVGSAAVQEDGAQNLVFTFTRSLVTADPLSVNFSLAGTATTGVDYTGLLPGTRLVTFAANEATTTLVLDPTADIGVEMDETVSITLAAGLGYSVGTTAAVVGTIANDDVVATTPVISLALSPSSVTEDGAANLVYTFTRSVVTASSLSVSAILAGSATNGSDYSGLLAGSTQTVTFAANAATATLVVNPTADNTVEGDETVSLQLAAGTGYSVGTVDAVTGLIVNDDPRPVLQAFTSGADTLSGSTAADTFQLNRLGDALWSGTPDRITNLQVGVDAIDAPTATGLAVRQLGAVSSLDAAGIGRVLTNKAFGKGAAASFTFNDVAGVRTFLAINDSMAGFNAATDSVLEITGFSGNLASLSLV